MKKNIPYLAVLVLVALFLFVFSSKKLSKTDVHETSGSGQHNQQHFAPTQSPLQEKPTQARSHKQQDLIDPCDINILNFNQEVGDIHQVVISALQQELQQGKTVKELLTYADQYKTFYKSYQDLLWQAQIRNEAAKYHLTSSASILKQWQGLTVIEGFSAAVLPILVENLTNIEGQTPGLNIALSLRKEVDKADIYQLLDNDETFNTYFQSPLSIAGSPVISPSILFVLTAQNLTIEEFSQAVSRRSFTVNDAAVAINNNLPTEYLQPLLQHTTALSDMPIFSFDRHDAYANLADLAAAKHSIAVLDMLDKHGVRPTNEPGIITGMDIAIMNLPRDAESYEMPDSSPEKYLNTLQYLKTKGYRAHGSRYTHSTGSELMFHAPNHRPFNTAQVPLPQIRTFLQGIELIDSQTYESQTPPQNAAITTALNLVNQRQAEISKKSADCQRQKELQLTEEGFLDHKHSLSLIEEIKQTSVDIPQQLHQIDPALVKIWQNYESGLSGAPSTADSSFITLLQSNEYQQAFDFVSSNPLNQAETDYLFARLPDFTEELMPLWQARVSPLAPSSLMMFRYLSLEKWQQLHHDKFDFSVQDRFGNDMFAAAILHSDAAVTFLLANGYSTDVGKLGLDVFDLLLEDSYQHQRLHPAARDIVPLILAPEPNHFSRIARLQKFRPQVYQQLISLDQKLVPPEGTEINKFRFIQ
ncbi:MAG: hypothetical protein KKE08_18955 [Gammaproteobacteria bacterium]|nr:hypothetical protein [Gammaproteobacteria bacterium]MBU2185109.1 hypothetical protein [Gammaproteobacteria bacterium]MBU2206977.1 hypothetical protein [Gammaproteobacteria bacterium]